MKNKFEGFYFKHHAGADTLALIPGRGQEEAFIQVITKDDSFYLPYPLSAYSMTKGIMRIGDNLFSARGIKLNICHDEVRLKGSISYRDKTPLAYDIMGPFSFFSMECRHKVVSMQHQLSGCIQFNGRKIDFSGGRGYIEGDSGTSFPDGYTWAQCNYWGKAKEEPCAIMASAAKIPFAKMKFWGCIAVVCLAGSEYRLATYKGAKIYRRNEQELVIIQKKSLLSPQRLCLRVVVPNARGQHLCAPVNGGMNRMIKENAAVKARVQFFIDRELVVDRWSEFAGYEYVQEQDIR